MSENVVNPIVADPQRQAIGPQSGYSYQAWQNVYQWITLKSEETLFLEGGEDIDVLKRAKPEPFKSNRPKQRSLSIPVMYWQRLAIFGNIKRTILS
jgi:hypothetical protein